MGQGAAPTARKAGWREGAGSGHVARPGAQAPHRPSGPGLPGPRLRKIFRVRDPRPRGWRGAEAPAGAGGRAPLVCGPSSPLRPAGRGPETLPGEAVAPAAGPGLRAGSAGSTTARPANPAGAEPPRGQADPGFSLLLCGLFFLQRISGNPTEIGSIEHLPNPLCLLSIYQSTFLIRLIRNALECL